MVHDRGVSKSAGRAEAVAAYLTARHEGRNEGVEPHGGCFRRSGISKGEQGFRARPSMTR